MTLQITSHGNLHFLITPPHGGTANNSILLFLHGKGEACASINGLPLVCMHWTPPWQAILQRIWRTHVIAPLAPYDPTETPDWSWTPHLTEIESFVNTFAKNRPIYATGFSRGGLGVLDLVQRQRLRLKKWALVDPQPMPKWAGLKTPGHMGWLAFGNGHPRILNFSMELSKSLDVRNVRRTTGLSHIELARRAYEGDSFGGRGHLYDFLGIRYALKR